MAGGLVAQMIYQVKREENEVGRTTKTHAEEVKANYYIVGGVLAGYLCISLCAYFSWAKMKRQRIAFVARSALLTMLIPPVNFSDPEQCQLLQLINLAHCGVCTFAAQTFAEHPLDLQIS